jgi:glycosidase
MEYKPYHPTLYEINTQVWLNELSRRYQRPITLGTVPDEEWIKLKELGVDYVWLMGVWQRSPAAVELVSNNPIAISEFKQMLPDFTLADLAGSPYSVRSYTVDPRLGGKDGLAAERVKLIQHGIHLILDFVSNHVAPDNPWTIDHPEYFIQGDEEDLARDPESFIQIGNSIFARGRDPNYAAWMDTIQLNAFHSDLRQASLDTLLDIFSQCDGVRVDMAMLFLNPVFSNTWGERAGWYPEKEFWQEIIPEVKQRYPAALFMAETYWDTERELLWQGFDYCYDKLLYDFIRDEAYGRLADHLLDELTYQHRLVRFVENHDEHRALTTFPNGHWKAAALTTATLPGMRMFYQGQAEGRRSRVSVLLNRWPDEAENPETQAFYQSLLKLISLPVFKIGDWQLLRIRSERTAPLKRCAAWMWNNQTEKYVVMINFGHDPADVYVHVPQINGQHQKILIEYWTGHVLNASFTHEQMEIFKVNLDTWDARVYRWARGG